MTIKNDLQTVVSVPDREQQEAAMLAAASETSSHLSSCCLCVHRSFFPGVFHRTPVLEGLLCEMPVLCRAGVVGGAESASWR